MTIVSLIMSSSEVKKKNEFKLRTCGNTINHCYTHNELYIIQLFSKNLFFY